MNYTTQMDAAKKGIITPEMEIVAKKENITAEELRERVARGSVAIPANKMHKAISPEGVGEGLKTKINVISEFQRTVRITVLNGKRLRWLLI